MQSDLVLEIMGGFLFWLWLSSNFVCILNTNGKEDLNQLECWAETNKMKWSRDKCKDLYFI